MQDELTKHGLKIYKTMADRKHSLGEKLREIIIEILIIVFAVTLSIWLHSWSEHRHEQKEVHEFLRGLKIDLTSDMRLIKENRDVIAKVNANFDNAFNLKKGQRPDSVIDKYFDYELVVTVLNDARYQGFKSSGKLGNIENDSLRQGILVYYQQTAPEIAYDESIANELQQKLLDFQIDKTDMPIAAFADLTKTKAILHITIHNLRNSVFAYDSSIRLTKSLIKQIDEEIAK